MDLNSVHGRFQLMPSDRVRVSMDRPANVMLLDDANFAKYAAGREYNYFGGHSVTSPVELAPPREGAWNVVVDADEDQDVAVKVEIVGNA